MKKFFDKNMIRRFKRNLMVLCMTMFLCSMGYASGVMVVGSNTDYTPYLEDDESGNDEIKKVCDKFLQDYISWNMTDFEKEMQIIKYLTSTVTYAYEEEDYDSDMPVPASMISDSFRAYGALVNRRAVCSGYAKAFELLARKCGLNAMIITGTGIDKNGMSSSHAWNQICLNNEWYNVDVTWETPIKNMYINCTDMDFSKSHIRNGGEVCTATKYGHDTVGYYLMTGQVNENVNMDDFRKSCIAVYQDEAMKNVDFKLDKNPLSILGSKFDDGSNYFTNDEQINNYVKMKLSKGEMLIIFTTPFGYGRNFSIDSGDWLKNNIDIKAHIRMQMIYEEGPKYDTRVLLFTIL